MQKLTNRWIIGFEVIIIWICLAYAVSTTISGSFLYAAIYFVLGLIVVAFSIMGLPQNWLKQLKPGIEPLIVFLTMGIMLLYFLIQSILQFQSSQTISTTTPHNYATYSTLVVILLVLLIDIYTYYQSRNQ